MIGVVFWELRQKDPVVDLHLLKERNFAISTFTMFVLGFVLYGSTMALPLFLQTLLGYTATQSGMALSPGGLAIMVMMPMVGLLLSRYEARWLVMFGLLVSSLGLYQMSRFNLQIDFRHAVMARIVQSLGLAFLFVPINTIAFYFIAKQNTSYATGLINLARNIGGSSGIALSTTLIARREQFHQQRLIEHLSPLDASYQSTLEAAKQMFLAKGADAAHAAAASSAIRIRHGAASGRDAGVPGRFPSAGDRVPGLDSADVSNEEDASGARRVEFTGALGLPGYRIRSSFSTLPSRMWITRCARMAMSASCVTTTMVFPWLHKRSNRPMISLPVTLSSAPVGSSASRMEGLFTSARATATRCRWPPESSLGL